MNDKDDIPYSKKFRTWIEIDKQAITKNYLAFREHLDKEVKIMSVVKSNAYGHDLVPFSKEVEKAGVDWLAVDSAVEAFALRESGIKIPILVLGYTLPDKFQEIVEKNIHIMVSSFAVLEDIKNAGLSEKILTHVKIDTGLARQGFMQEDMEKLFLTLGELKDIISVEGLYTHFAAAKDPNNPDATHNQLVLFKKWINVFRSEGYDPLVHACATSSTILFPEAHFDMVRVGIGMCGLWPSPETKNFAEKGWALYPALSWKTIISEIKKLPQGSFVGYGLTEKLERDSKIAVCPVGYWHGYMKRLSCKSFVLVRGKRAKVLGLISMDMTLIDITDILEVNVGDEVILIGTSKEERISAEELACVAETVNYEIITCINSRIKRIYVP